MMEVRARIREFVTTNFYVPDTQPLQDDDSLLGRGIVDSTGVLELMSFLEEAFSVAVTDEEAIPENLDSVSRIASFIERRTATA